MEPIIMIGILSIQIEVKKDKREKMKEKLAGLPTNIRLGRKVTLSDKHSKSLRCRIIYNHKNFTVREHVYKKAMRWNQ